MTEKQHRLFGTCRPGHAPGACPGGFSGSNTVSNLLFSLFQYPIADQLDISTILVVSLQNEGGAMGNMISVHNTIASCATVGLVGMEGWLISEEIQKAAPDVIISLGGGSTIDAVKAAIAVQVLGGDIEDYFGAGKVGNALDSSGKKLTPHIAIQSAASSAAHLTKYSNITNLSNNQKKLIIDESIVPKVPVFDYAVPLTAELVDEYMGSILHAARTGDLTMVKTL